MTVHSFWQQALAENAATTRKLSQLLWKQADGVAAQYNLTPLKVSAQGTPNMTVKVDAGWAKKGGYLAFNDAQIAALTIPTADPFLPRKDYVVVRWYDTENGDGSAQGVVEVLQGTPNASPSPPSLTGKTVQVLALIDVAAATTSIAGSAITDQRSLVYTDLYDTGWLSLSGFASGWSIPPGGFVAQVRQIGIDVTFRGFLKNTTFSGGFTTVCNLPSGIVKPDDYVTVSVGGNTALVRSAQLSAAGDLQMWAEGATASLYSLAGLRYRAA